MNLLTIAVLSLSIGLIAGAGANENFILPVTLSAAAIFIPLEIKFPLRKYRGN